MKNKIDGLLLLKGDKFYICYKSRNPSARGFGIVFELILFDKKYIEKTKRYRLSIEKFKKEFHIVR